MKLRSNGLIMKLRGIIQRRVQDFFVLLTYKCCQDLNFLIECGLKELSTDYQEFLENFHEFSFKCPPMFWDFTFLPFLKSLKFSY